KIIAFDRKYEDDFKSVNITLYNTDGLRYHRKIYLLSPIIGGKGNGDAYWTSSKACQPGKSDICLTTYGHINFAVREKEESWNRIDCPDK
ncbi:hypothetical protein PFISCL1PPCAC_27150, partial [Pristionchus fissidentatus]